MLCPQSWEEADKQHWDPVLSWFLLEEDPRQEFEGSVIPGSAGREMESKTRREANVRYTDVVR